MTFFNFFLFLLISLCEQGYVIVEASEGEILLRPVAAFVRRRRDRWEVANGGEQVRLEPELLVDLEPQVMTLRILLEAGDEWFKFGPKIACYTPAPSGVLITHAGDEAVALHITSRNFHEFENLRIWGEPFSIKTCISSSPAQGFWPWWIDDDISAMWWEKCFVKDHFTIYDDSAGDQIQCYLIICSWSKSLPCTLTYETCCAAPETPIPSWCSLSCHELEDLRIHLRNIIAIHHVHALGLWTWWTLWWGNFVKDQIKHMMKVQVIKSNVLGVVAAPRHDFLPNHHGQYFFERGRFEKRLHPGCDEGSTAPGLCTLLSLTCRELVAAPEFIMRRIY